MRVCAAACALLLALGTCVLAGCGTGGAAKRTALDPSDPVQVEFWTYYNGAQQKAFEGLVEEFNATKGKDLGVVVAHASQGGVNDLASAVTAAAQGLVGAEDMPAAFLSYSDTAYVVDQLGKVADLSPYFTDEERAAFVDSFLAEGDLDGNGSIKVLPVAKSTETMQINLTDWQAFADATGASLDDLRTVEGITETAERYYQWTDAKTPDVADDGRPFFGRDALANYLLTGSRQLGHDVVSVEGGQGTASVDKETMRRLWDNYYVPLVNGSFSDEGRFRSDAVKTGDLVCYVGSSSAVVYFPKTVTVDDSTSYPIELAALPAPTFEGAVPCAPQQGAGFVVAKSDERTEEACVEFLKWFTAKEQNTSFALSAGYVPVTKDALTQDNIEAEAKALDTDTTNYLANLPATLETIEAGVYANPPFHNGVETRAVLEKALSDQADADRAQVVAAIEAGTPRAQAVAAFTADEHFETWLASFEDRLAAALAA